MQYMALLWIQHAKELQVQTYYNYKDATVLACFGSLVRMLKFEDFFEQKGDTRF